MERSTTIIVMVCVALVIAGVWYFVLQNNDDEGAAYGPEDVHAILAIRSFQGAELKTEQGQTANYTVHVGEEFKITWATANLIEDGQVVYQGPEGVGAGIIPIARGASISADAPVPFKSFKAAQPGTGSFILTATGKGPTGTTTLSNTINVDYINY
ncbi:MAG: hypothetical protein A3A33_01760 [Candidatus Yanofskybacteria bacterium RIFCSPLOWO2_01_FULL_49_25]|uniref:Uncharacterized protein n=1 Tax=Candidatus Yanofskybacteria bacterium RIFCSPLOWO2_01_FULL_49_25 TaxID=1802701 RepID=A0A1F8GXM8_9BACT|nr:MAG: hypothetical protein A3A33_01760 [Candidatus Yanofskybacteria bacterium RIFCSPLOWO2_01_FULL_49_25]